MADRFNRKMLAEVFKDPRLLRDFEDLSRQVDAGLPELVQDAQSTADTALAQAVAAQGTASSAASAAATAQSTANTALTQGMIATVVNTAFSYFESNTRGYVVVLCNAAGGAVNVNLPPCSSCAGMIVCIKKTDGTANAAQAIPSGVQTIDGAASRSVTTQYARFTIMSDGTNWQVIA